MADDALPIETELSLVEPPSAWEKRFSVSEFERLGEAGVLGAGGDYELWDGRVMMAPVPGSSHSVVDGKLIGLLTVELSRLGQLWKPYIVAANAGVRLNETTLLGADVAVIEPGAGSDSAYHRLSEFRLCVETAVTTLGTDLGFKRERYAAAEIPEYWVIDVAARSVHVFRQPARGDYTEHARMAAGDTLSPLFEPNITIVVAELF